MARRSHQPEPLHALALLDFAGVEIAPGVHGHHVHAVELAAIVSGAAHPGHHFTAVAGGARISYSSSGASMEISASGLPSCASGALMMLVLLFGNTVR